MNLPAMRPLLLLACTIVSCLSLAPPSRPVRGRSVHPPLRRPSPLTHRHRDQCTSTQLHSGGNQFDITKPTFDLLSFRPIRSDALLRYNSLNQSEPLRINLFLLATVTLLGYPLWGESVTGYVPSLPATIGAFAAGVGSAGLFWRERTRRSNQLSRMEKELNAERLLVSVPVNTAISSARPTAALKELRGKRRIVAIRGNKEQLSNVVDAFCTLRNRLVQSQTLVVMVPTDGSTRDDWGCDKARVGDALWLADPIDADGDGGWLEYFRELLGNDNYNADDELAWFALNFKGRSIASGLRDPPRILELLGQQLPPMDILDEADDDSISESMPTANDILACQKKFYNVLTSSSDEKEMQPIFSTKEMPEVNEVVEGGGRIDGWNTCLAPDARPANMVISGADVWFASDGLAYSTCIEFPTNAGIDGATLLAVQRWRKDEGEWKLELHQTIPWSPGSRAGGTLRCDCRGCVALARAAERRTFGGIIG